VKFDQLKRREARSRRARKAQGRPPSPSRRFQQFRPLRFFF
jgi:hypothetical protein